MNYRDCTHEPKHDWVTRAECVKATMDALKATPRKREKHVFNTEEIPHLWFHKAQYSARNPLGNLYFENETIYSYGRHFPIARHIASTARGMKGKTAVLFTRDQYSVTTTRHINMVRQAIPEGTVVFNVPIVWAGSTHHNENQASYIAWIDSHILTSARARSSSTKEHYHSVAVELRNEAILYAKFFGLKKPKIAEVPALDSDALKAIKAKEHKRLSKQSAKAKAARLVREQQDIAERAQAVEDFRAGKPCRSYYDMPVMLRITEAETRNYDETGLSDITVETIIETSKGATFPIGHAKRGLALIKSVVARGEAWQANGHTCRLGAYKIDSIDADGTVHAGCHVVPYSEILLIAPAIEAYLK